MKLNSAVYLNEQKRKHKKTTKVSNLNEHYLFQDATVRLYLRNGATANKLVIGIPTYGRAFKLAASDLTDIGSPSDGPAEPGKSTREKGYLAYYEVRADFVICLKCLTDDAFFSSRTKQDMRKNRRRRLVCRKARPRSIWTICLQQRRMGRIR